MLRKIFETARFVMGCILFALMLGVAFLGCIALQEAEFHSFH